MKKIALLSCEKIPLLSLVEQPLVQAFINANIEAVPCVWDIHEIEWESFGLIVCRNTWDYFQKYEAFMAFLAKIEKLGVPFYNSIETIRWNSHKFYLRDLEKQGVNIIPTLFSDKLHFAEIEAKNWPKIVIKPAVSADSFLTEIFEISQKAEIEAKLEVGDWLVQPFMNEITKEGEISMIFIDNEYSHSVIKTPKEGDFRVQRNHGGTERRHEVSDSLIAIGKDILSKIPEKTLYARIDGVLGKNAFLLMEIELIEPDLFYAYEPQSAQKLALACQKLINL